MQNNCPFCAVADDNAPSFDVLEDRDTIAFLDANPATDGHMLVVPRNHAARLTDLDSGQTAALFDSVRTVTATIEDAWTQRE